uniref:Odorant receptor n=1 Tax=Adelphocoris lineolatus TaxID=236346 RepID=A0A2I4PH71_ADELI|nr:olfactory receptor 63 [Adelphocoris lineolatus]
MGRSVPDLPDLVRLLRFCGLYYTFNGPRAKVYENLQPIRPAFVVATSIMGIIALFVGGLRSSLGIEMCYALLGLVTSLQCVHFYLRREDTESTIELFQEIREKFQKGSEEEFKNNTRGIWMVVKVYGFLLVGTCMAMSLPFCTDLVIWAIWKTPKAFRIPMGMDSFLDKEPIRDAKYFFVMFAAGSWTIIGSIAQLGADAFLFVACFSYSSMVMTFCKSLTIHSNLTPKETTAHLKRVAAHQQQLFKLSVKMRLLFGLPFFVQNLFGAICICSLLFVISTDDSINMLKMFAYLINLLVTVSILGCTAYVGQHVKNKTSEVFEAIYEMNWYELRPSDRRYLVTMLSAAREPMSIDFYGLLPLDMENFMKILNTSYSYFMFLKSMI